MKEYKLVSSDCVNSKWTAKFLAKKNQEYCECPFDCFVKVKHIKSNYDFIISKADYYELKSKRKL